MKKPAKKRAPKPTRVPAASAQETTAADEAASPLEQVAAAMKTGNLDHVRDVRAKVGL